AFYGAPVHPNLTKAITFYERATGVLEEVVRAEPGASEARANLANTYWQIGSACQVLGKPSETNSAMRRAVKLQEELVRDFPALPHFRELLAHYYEWLGTGHNTEGLSAEARELFEKAIQLQLSLVAEPHGWEAYGVEWLRIQGSYIDFLNRNGRAEG